jgi:hypothetical protein
MAVLFVYYFRSSWPFPEFHVISTAFSEIAEHKRTVSQDPLQARFTSNEAMWSAKHILSVGWSNALVRDQCHLWAHFVSTQAIFSFNRVLSVGSSNKVVHQR